MKNKRIIDAWNKIEPDVAATERMLVAILAHNNSSRSEKGKSYPLYGAPGRKRVIPVAVCLAAVFVLVAVFGNSAGWFGDRVYTADLGNAGILNFHKTDIGVGSMDFGVDVISRELTADENRILFGELPVTSYAMFNATDKALLHVDGDIKGKTGVAKVILAAPGVPVTDTIIDTEIEVSDINGVPVSAGYFVTDANSRGVKNIIYLASFDRGGVSVYVALGGEESESEALRSEIATIIDSLTQNSVPDLSAITE